MPTLGPGCCVHWGPADSPRWLSSALSPLCHACPTWCISIPGNSNHSCSPDLSQLDLPATGPPCRIPDLHRLVVLIRRYLCRENPANTISERCTEDPTSRLCSFRAEFS